MGSLWGGRLRLGVLVVSFGKSEVSPVVVLIIVVVLIVVVHCNNHIILHSLFPPPPAPPPPSPSSTSSSHQTLSLCHPPPEPQTMGRGWNRWHQRFHASPCNILCLLNYFKGMVRPLIAFGAFITLHCIKSTHAYGDVSHDLPPPIPCMADERVNYLKQYD